MAFENRFYLSGIVNTNIKYGTTVNGDTYAWFAVRLENKLGVSSTDYNYNQNLGVTVFNQNIIKYMKRVNMKRNDNVVVFGFLSAFTQQIKGDDYTGHGINATQLFVVKKAADD